MIGEPDSRESILAEWTSASGPITEVGTSPRQLGRDARAACAINDDGNPGQVGDLRGRHEQKSDQPQRFAPPVFFFVSFCLWEVPDSRRE